MVKIDLHQRLAALIASVMLLSTISAAQDRKSADEEAVRRLADQYFAAFRSKEVAKPMSFWSTNSQDLASRREQMQELFARIDNIEIRNLEVRSTAIDGDKAVMRVAVEVLGVETKTGKPAPELGRVNRTLHLVKESGAWKIQNEVPAEDELAASLINAKSATEREDLLAADKELMTVNLRKALISRGNDLANRRALSQALDVFRLALRVAETIDDKAGVVRASYGIGRVLKDQNDNAQALKYYEKTLAFSEASDDKEMIARVLNNIGVVYRIQAKNDQALEFFERSLNVARKIGNKQAIANALLNMGNAYAFQGKYSLAIEHHRQALAENEAIGNRVEISRGLNNIGNLHATLGNLVEAQDSFITSLALSESLGNKELIGMTLYNLGNVHSIRGDYIQALEYYTKALKRAEGSAS